MSELLAAAAAALNSPETIVRRSAEAKAKATGVSVDDVLRAWAGGGDVPTAPGPAAEPAPTQPAGDTPTQPAGDTPAQPGPEAAPPGAVTVLAAPAVVPVLEGRVERPFTVMLGAAAILLIALLAGLVAPAAPQEGNGVYTSAVPLTESGLAGRVLYRSLGCGACHSQMVRPLAIDAGLGGVTIFDSNQELGIRRYGPDLANVAVRTEDPGVFATVLGGVGDHPAYPGLAAADLDNLVAYLTATNAAPEEPE